ncbi:23539_t:CDS:2 [Gigaspora margarita]|uniref:23539_t:CDS:1 n=1 Tax=Gigaspora margarita TaxID=4874 RepID=A0ABN7VDF7_GIGMA|nr:23539_t:CDS:2 [Gigaspora margarita]
MDEEIGSEEDDDDKEINESTIKILRNITDICTRWNSNYFLWTRLLELKDAITCQYPTLSIMYPIIRKLQNQFIEFGLESSNENSDDEDDMLLDSENYDDTPPPPPDLDQIEKQFKIAIGMIFVKEREKAETKLRNEFENLYFNITSNDQPEQQTSMVTVTEIMQNLFFEGIFGVQDQEDTLLDKECAIKKVPRMDILIGWNKLA